MVAWAGLTGDSAYLAVADQLASEVVEIFPGAYAFAALKTDGSLVTWGWPSDGGDSSAVADQLSSGVVEAYSGESVFAALKDDGSVVVWRGAEDGIEDDAAGVADQLTSGVVEVSNIFTNRYLVNGSEDDDTLHGYAGQNWINGHDGNDLIFGSLWDDQLQGHEGDDIIHPGLGNDVVYGGTGTDTIVLPLFANEFTYESQGPEHFDVSYRDFLIEVVGVEFVEFGSEHITRLDLQEALSSDLQTQIARLTDLYLAFFGRAPDVEGLEFWQKQLLGEGRSFQNIAKDFASGEEAQTLFPQDASNREFVQNIYQNVFDRNPDSGGWDFWTNKLDGLGTTDLSERGAFVGELILGAYAPTSGEEDRGLLTNKHDIAMYYVNELALDPAEGFDASINDLLELVTGEPETAENAERVIDYVFEDSITLVGVMSDQALLDELWAG